MRKAAAALPIVVRVPLPEPMTSAGQAGVAALLANPAGALLAVDFDGTLAPIVRRPEEAFATPGAIETLGRLAEILGRVVVLTGRPAEQAVTLGGLHDVAGLLVLGHYGLQRWEAGRLQTPRADPAVARALARLPELPAGTYVEDKGLSFAVHTRRCADPAAALAALDGPLRAVAADAGLEVVDGSFTRELRPTGTDKGRALRALARAEHPSAVLVLGDDDGDLPAADAVAELRAGGVPGLVVCAERAGGSLALRAQADVVVAGVEGVRGFLVALVAALESSTSQRRQGD